MSFQIFINCGQNFNDKIEIENRIIPHLKSFGYEMTCHTTPEADTIIDLISYKGE